MVLIKVMLQVMLLLAYQTAYLKTNFPYEFMTATLNYAIDRTDRIILLKKELSRLKY